MGKALAQHQHSQGLGTSAFGLVPKAKEVYIGRLIVRAKICTDFTQKTEHNLFESYV
jgi:hypothetical protein